MSNRSWIVSRRRGSARPLRRHPPWLAQRRLARPGDEAARLHRDVLDREDAGLLRDDGLASAHRLAERAIAIAQPLRTAGIVEPKGAPGHLGGDRPVEARPVEADDRHLAFAYRVKR